MQFKQATHVNPANPEEKISVLVNCDDRGYPHFMIETVTNEGRNVHTLDYTNGRATDPVEVIEILTVLGKNARWMYQQFGGKDDASDLTLGTTFAWAWNWTDLFPAAAGVVWVEDHEKPRRRYQSCIGRFERPAA